MLVPEQHSLIWLAVDLGILALAVLGVAVWTGWWRNWAANDDTSIDGIAGAPWLALTAIMVRAGYFMEPPIDFGLPPEAKHVLVLVCFALGLVPPYWHFPNWALPPWYRRKLKKWQADEPGGDGTAR